MPREIEPTLLEHIKRHAVGRLTPAQAQKTNLSVNRRIFEKGEHVGPPTQRITVTEPTLVIFADDDPLANWGHPCRYMLYDAEHGNFRREIHARLPSGNLEAFFQPLTLKPTTMPSVGIYWPRPRRCPIIIPDGNRYALLFAGFTMQRHLNDLEFCYRTLVNTYAVPPQNIITLSFNGTLTVVNDNWTGSSAAPAHWPGDGTPYQMIINGQGTLAGLQNAFAQLAKRLGPEDLLFIHTNNHGDTDNTGAYLGYPSAFPGGSGVDWGNEWVNLYASTFGQMLQTLPKYRALITMMEQCGSGGFGPTILETSTAAQTSFAAACVAGASSYGATYLGAPWDAFAYQWIAALAGQYPNGSPLASNPDTDGSFVVDVGDCFNYAQANGTSADSPNSSGAGANPNKLVLAEEYRFIWFWCWLFATYNEPYYERVLAGKLTQTEFMRRMNKIVPDLKKMVLPEADKTLGALRHKFGPEMKRALEAVFEE